MSWYRVSIEKNIEKIDAWIAVEEEKLKTLYELKGKYDSYLKDYDSYKKRMKNKIEKLRMDRLIKKLHKQFYKECDEKRAVHEHAW
jgi:molecular chaperone GrpE (heat shock protein)